MASIPAVLDAPDEKEPNGIDDSGDLFRRLKGWVKNAQEHLSDWQKEEGEESFDFYVGRQWSDEEKEKFNQDNRAAPILNLIGVTVDAVCGLEVNNRQDVKYLPRTPGDVQVNELLSSAAMWVRDQAQSEDEESDAFKDAVISGIGVTETRKLDEENIAIDRRDPSECFYDPTAKKPNLIDRRFGGRIVMMDTDEAQALFPGIDPVVLDAKWAKLGIKSDKTEELLDYPDHQRSGTAIPNAKPKKICLVEIEYYDWEGITKVYKQAFLGATSVLELNPLEAWAYNFITGKRDKNKNSWYGVVKGLKDAQRVVNKFLSTAIHILATNAKGGLLYERGVFTNQAQAEKDWSNPQKNVEVAEGAIAAGRIQPRTAPPLPPGITQIIDLAIQMFGKISGVNVELLGAADRDQPASLEMQRRQSAVTILASLFDAKRRYHKEQGKTLLALMKTLPPQMLVRVMVDPDDPMLMPPLPPPPPGTPPQVIQQAQQQAEAQWKQAQAQEQDRKQREMFVQFQLVAKAFQDNTIKFDVIVDEAPSSPNQQQEILAKLSMLAAKGMPIPPAAQAIIIKNIGLPSTMADDLAKAYTDQDPQVMQLTQQLQQGQQVLEQTQNELQGVKLDKGVEFQRAQVDQYKAVTERQKADSDSIAQTGAIVRGGQQIPPANYIQELEAQLQRMHTG